VIFSPLKAKKARFEPRLDSDWDTYMCSKPTGLLGPELGEGRKPALESAKSRRL